MSSSPGIGPDADAVLVLCKPIGASLSANAWIVKAGLKAFSNLQRRVQ
jgi:hypothetical protein